MHYAESRGIAFDDILTQAQTHYLSEQLDQSDLAIGSTVQLDGPAADQAARLVQATRGGITGFLIPDTGPTQYYVHFLGESDNRSFLADDLVPAPPFPATPTAEGTVDDPLRAEEILLETMTRIGRADVQGTEPQYDDLADYRELLNSFVTWTGMKGQNAIDLLLDRIESRLPPGTQAVSGVRPPNEPLTPGQLAAQAFPGPLHPPKQPLDSERGTKHRPDGTSSRKPGPRR